MALLLPFSVSKILSLPYEASRDKPNPTALAVGVIFLLVLVDGKSGPQQHIVHDLAGTAAHVGICLVTKASALENCESIRTFLLSIVAADIVAQSS
jgi:hypothetical protein